MKPKPFEFPQGESFYDVLKRLVRVKPEDIGGKIKEKESKKQNKDKK